MLLLHIAYSEEDAEAHIQFAFGQYSHAACLYVFEIHWKKSHPRERCLSAVSFPQVSSGERPGGKNENHQGSRQIPIRLPKPGVPPGQRHTRVTRPAPYPAITGKAAVRNLRAIRKTNPSVTKPQPLGKQALATPGYSHSTELSKNDMTAAEPTTLFAKK